MSGTPVIFNVAYTPYKLKKGSTEEEIKAHAGKRAYYDFTGDTNYLRYMTTEGKLTGNESKKFTMLDYLQKSTGVFNGDGMIYPRKGSHRDRTDYYKTYLTRAIGASRLFGT